MNASDLRRKFIDFFINKHAHVEIKSSSLIPENDPTVLFTTAGMHPLVPYLMGEVHPSGKRLVDVQKCLRTDDIDEVGDTTHCTFFEMLGNWSLGDYFKKEAIQMSYEFLTTPWEKGGLGLDPDRLAVSCFAGDNDAPRDDEAAEAWENLGFTRAENASAEKKRLIYFYGKKQNWWGPAGQTGPCGPDTEMFYDLYPELAQGEHCKKPEDRVLADKCHPDCDCKRYVEIWNDVFMQYFKKEDGTFEVLKQQNVDTGMGLERVLAIITGKKSHFETELFAPVIEEIQKCISQNTDNFDAAEAEYSLRIIADHIRAATFIMGDHNGITPSNTDQCYVLRRLIRRAIRHMLKLKSTTSQSNENFLSRLGEIFIGIYGPTYPELATNKDRILTEFTKEEEKFSKTLEQGLKEMRKIWNQDEFKKNIEVTDGSKAFHIYETYGFPIEMIEEELLKSGYSINIEEFRKSFNEAMKRHQDKSRTGSEQKFSGGLADSGFECTMLHTATHLLHKALQIVLGPEVNQKGSNITAERLRFDFNYPQKMTTEQIRRVEEIVNEQIRKDLPVNYEIVTVAQAKAKGAAGLFENKYGENVKAYKIGDFSYEICGGPHAEHTAQLGHFKILKEEASSAGIRRIKATVIR